MDINTLRKTRTDFTKITAELDKISNPKSYEDTRFWKPERDKAGNASATIRFLPSTEGDELPWVKLFSHGFQGPTGRWYIENSLTTIGKQDPVSELNSKLFNSTTDDNSPERKQARAQKRKLNYISNIIVVNDPKHPENNGKNFLFKFGKKIFDKIMDKAQPTFEDENPINVFDYWEGANFKLRMKTVDGYPNYDASEFEKSSEVADSDEEILKIANQQYKLAEFLDQKNFKSYDELKTKLNLVLSGDSISESASDFVEIESAPISQKSAPKMKSKSNPSLDDDEDSLEYFKQLANEA